jgi:hypothetical protein
VICGLGEKSREEVVFMRPREDRILLVIAIALIVILLVGGSAVSGKIHIDIPTLEELINVF